MAVPRPVLIAILGMGLILAALLATRNAGQAGETAVTPAAPAKKPAADARSKPDASASKQPSRSRERSPAQRPASKPAARGERAPQKSGNAALLRVNRALAANKVAVLFITRGGAADDVAVRAAVQSVEAHGGRVAVFSDGIQNLAQYQPILAGVGVSQVPSVVIVRPGRRARLIEGYVDEASLRQHVTDALR